jgi:ankyrin repeat protein
MVAMKLKTMTIVKHILDSHGDGDVLDHSQADCDGNTIFMLACKNCPTGFVLKLMERYGDALYPQAANCNGDTALMLALKLIRAGEDIRGIVADKIMDMYGVKANFSAIDSIGNTPFILACDSPYAYHIALKMVDLYGDQINTQAVNKVGESALDLAFCNFSPLVYDAIIKLLNE